MKKSPALPARRELIGLLGDLPPLSRRARVLSSRSSRRGKLLVERLVLDLNGLEPVPALAVSFTDGLRRKPAVLYCHSHGGFYDLGKDELFKPAPYLRTPGYGIELAEAGYTVLCIDNWGFGERHTATESSIFKLMLWQGRTMWGMMVYDNLKAMEYLRSRPDVDPTRTATLGMSMGSTMAWWIAALDPAVSACADLCCLTDFKALIETGGLDRHGVYYYIPGLLKRFSTAQINALIAPRPHLSLAGTKDPLTPVAGLDRIDRELKTVYRRAGAAANWRLLRYPVAHQETAAMRREVLTFLRARLSP